MRKLHKEVQKWLKEGMFDSGWRIEITNRNGDVIRSNRCFISDNDVRMSKAEIMKYNIEKMLKEFDL